MRKYSSNLAFVDFLFILLLAFITLFILALILINPITKKSEIERKAEFLIILEWGEKSEDDVDLWVQDPLANIVSFRKITAGLMHLDKDDLGIANDTIYLPNGTEQIIYLNREVITLRGWVEGEYIINTHMYSKRDSNPIKVKVEMLRLNPYKILFKENFILRKRGEEITVRRVTLDKDGYLVSTNKLQKSFINIITY
jgi:hypothetical protein